MSGFWAPDPDPRLPSRERARIAREKAAERRRVAMILAVETGVYDALGDRAKAAQSWRTCGDTAPGQQPSREYQRARRRAEREYRAAHPRVCS